MHCTGAHAVVRGLRGRPELNDVEVELLEYLPTTGRWGVRIVNDATHLSLKPDNLEVLTPRMLSVRLWLNPSLLPHSSNARVLDVLREIGICHVGRDDLSAASAVDPFEMSADDLAAYEDTQSVEPASVAMLRFVCWLLVAPSASLAQLSTAGGGRAASGSFERGAIGRALVAVVDYSLSMGCTSAGGSSDGTRTQEEERRRTLLRWRAAFARTFGLRLDGQSPHTIWTRVQVHALSALSLLSAEPETAAVAQRASRALREEARGTSDGVHVEDGWLRDELLSSVRAAAEETLSHPAYDHHRRPSRVVATIDLLRTAISEAHGGAAATAGLAPPLIEVARLLERLRLELCSCTGRALLECASLLLIHATGGAGAIDVGQFVRDSPDSDAQAGEQEALDTSQRRTKPSLMLLVFLGPGGVDVGAGALSLADHLVAIPRAGTLVLLDSAVAARASLQPVGMAPTVCVACTFFEGSVHRFHSSGAVNLASVVLLDEARDARRVDEATDARSHGDEPSHTNNPLPSAHTAACRDDISVAHVSQADGKVRSDEEEVEEDMSAVAAWRALGLVD